MAEHANDVEMLQSLSKELSNMCPDGNKTHIQAKMDDLSKTFNAFKDTVKEKYASVVLPFWLNVNIVIVC